MFKLTLIAVILWITTVINFFAFYISWQRRRTRTGLYCALGMLAVTFWTLAAGFDYAAIPIPLKVFFAKLEYLGSTSALAFFALFVISYAGYEDWPIAKWLKALIVFLTLFNIILAWTNDLHGWLWSGFVASEFGDNTVIFEHGPGYVWTTINGYLMILMIIIPLWQASRRGSELGRRQARVLFFSSLVPVVGNLVYLFEDKNFQGVDWSSITFSLSSLLFLRALYGTRLLDLAPIARDKLISGLSDGMIALDLKNRIIDINPAAAQMLEAQPATLIGQELAEVMPSARHFLEQAPEQEMKTELEVGTATKRYFDVLVSPLRGRQTNVIGHLIIFRDITERKQVETERAAWAGVLQATFDSATAGILVLDNNGQMILGNKQLAKIWPIGEIQPVVDSPYPFLTAIEPFVKNFSDVTRFFEAQRHQSTEENFIRMLLSDGRIFDIRTAPYYTGSEITGQVWTFENVTTRIRADKADVLIEERRRISQEAHDGLLQGLVGLRLQLKHWHKLIDHNPARMHTNIDELQTFVTGSIDEMRRFIFALRPAPLDTGFDEAVRQLASGMQRYYQLSVEVEISGPLARLHRDWEQALFRVIQEALSNIGKHAQATQAWVTIDLTNSEDLIVMISDNGRGFDSSAAKSHSHGFGLGNMSERIKSLGGHHTIASQPGQGTTVLVSVPYNAL